MIRRLLKVAFQIICAGVTRIRHGGSEESVDAVQRQFFLVGFTESADVTGSALRGPDKQKSAEKGKPNNTFQGVEEMRGLYFNS